MNKSAIGGTLAVLLALSIGGNVWLYLSGARSSKATQDVARVSSLKDSMLMQVAKLDSLQNLLNSTQADRENLANKVDELESGGSADLKAQVADLQSKIAYYQSLASQSGAAVQQAAADGRISPKESAKLSKIRKELEEKIKEVEQLNAQIATLTSEKNQLISDRDQAIADKSNSEQKNRDLQDKVKYGAVPQYGSLVTVGMAMKSGKKIETYKLKGLENFKITFKILENKLVTPDASVNEEVTIRIVGPGGEVLSTNNKNMENSDDVFSLKKTVSFNGEEQEVEWNYPKSGRLDVKLHKGRYKAELWARGKMQQLNIFELN